MCSGAISFPLPVCLSDRYVLLGNHHDAWTFGAVDPNSGTAVLMELARALSDLRSKGQSPWTAVTRLGVTVKVLISLSLSVPRLETRSNHSPLQLGCRGIWTDWILRMD